MAFFDAVRRFVHVCDAKGPARNVEKNQGFGDRPRSQNFQMLKTLDFEMRFPWIHDRELLRRFETVDKLPDGDKSLAKEILDFVIMKNRFKELVDANGK
jgi:hypothetical protein